MKILHLISSVGLFGAEQIVLFLSRHFNQGDMVSIVGALNNTRNSHLEIVDEAEKEGLPVASFLCAGRVDFKTVLQIKRYCAEQQIDILHTHNYKSNVIGLLAARLAGIPCMATAHGYTDMTRQVSWYERFDRFILRFFNKVVVVSDCILPYFPDKKKVIIANGIDVNRFRVTGDLRSVTRAEFGIGESDFVVGTVGRLSKEKNQILLLQAAGALATGHPHLKVLIVGNGPEEDRLKMEVRRLKMEGHVVFAGLRTDMTLVYQTMDIFVLTSLTEGVPMAILEAMASRLPVVATCVGGIPEIIKDDENGFLVPSGDVKSLAEKLSFLMTAPQKAKALAESAVNLVKTSFSHETMVSGYRQIYESILEDIK